MDQIGLGYNEEEIQMNDLIVASSNAGVTMSSREIADLPLPAVELHFEKGGDL